MTGVDPSPEPEPRDAAGSGAASPGPEPRVARGLLLRIVRDQRVAFLIVGGINTGIGFGSFVVIELLLGRNLGQFGYLVTLLLSHVFSVICAFFLHRTFVFRVRGHLVRDLLRFEVVNLTSLGINFVLLPVLVEFLHLNPILAQFLIVFVTTLVSYVGHKYFSFRRPARPAADGTADSEELHG